MMYTQMKYAQLTPPNPPSIMSLLHLLYMCKFVVTIHYTVNQEIFGVQIFSDDLLVFENKEHENFLKISL